MRITLLCILLIWCNYAISQKKPVPNKLIQINEQADKVHVINSLELYIKEIYTGSFNWVYQISNEPSKQVLRDQISTKGGELLAELTTYPLQDNSGQLLKEKLSKYIESTNENTQMLVSFEDYADTTNTSPYLRAKANLQNKIRLQFEELNKMIEEIKNDYENELLKMLSENPKGQSYSVIRDQCERINYFYKANILAWEVYYGSFYWIYQPEDTSSKEKLKEVVTTGISQTQANLKNVDEIQSEIVIDYLKKLRSEVEDIQNILKTKEDEEQALNLLLAEDALETRIYPIYNSLRKAIDNELLLKKTELKTLLEGDLDAKTTDIRKMLKYNYKNLAVANNFNDILDKLVVLYAKQFSHKEIKEIIRFQESKTGKKLRETENKALLEVLESLGNRNR